MICHGPADRASPSLGSIAVASQLIAQCLQPLRNRDQLVLDTVDGDSILAPLRDLPHGLQRLVEARDGIVDATQHFLIWRHQGTPLADRRSVR
jgi:hypothetical protein